MEAKTRNGVLNQELRSIGTPFWSAHACLACLDARPLTNFFFLMSFD